MEDNRKKKEIKKRKRKISLLARKRIQLRDVKNTLEGNDLRITTTSRINSPFSNAIALDGINCNRGRKRRRRSKKSFTIDLVESDDDCVIMSSNIEGIRKKRKDNNNTNEDEVRCISSTSVIEISSGGEDESENEAIGIATGIVEKSIEQPCTSKDIVNPWSIVKLGYGQDKPGLLNYKTVDDLTNRLNKNYHKYNKNKKNQCSNETHTKNTDTVNENLMNNINLLPKQISRQSISYQPSDTMIEVHDGLRPIVIDGSNVAFGHGKERFSARGIQICVEYFVRRKHKIVHAFVPQFRRRHPATVGIDIMDRLEKQRHVIYTPSRLVDGKRVTAYDDRYIVEYATKTGGIIITRDNYQDLLAENQAWSDAINFRILQYTFIGDMIMFPSDPLGRGGPTLDKFLRF